MTISVSQHEIRLEGDCYVEDAEQLANLLLEFPDRTVDISTLGTIHTAVFQALLAFRPVLLGSSRDEFFERWIKGLLDGGR
jgi:hypothetical protein